MLLSLLYPLVSAEQSQQSETENNAENNSSETMQNPMYPPGTVIGDLSEFNPAEHGKMYLYNDEDNPIYSATRFFKQEWIDAGRPNLVLPFADEDNGRTTSGRAPTPCTPTASQWVQGGTGVVPTDDGDISVTAKKVTANAAFLVQNGQTVNSAILNSFSSDWEGLIYPTNTQYFGQPPDQDGNCQIEIIIYAIDGPASIGGYFDPSISSQREAIYVDVDDTGGSFGKVILAHEFQHLLHNSRDPYEFIWIDEGNADMAAFMNFGMDSTLIGHTNAWTSNPGVSIRWWAQKEDTSDYGGAFLFMLYLHDQLGGSAAIQQLVADLRTGGNGIEHLAQNAPNGASNIGTTMTEIFANFAIAASIDSDQAPYGIDSLSMVPSCGGSSAACVIQPVDTHSSWSAPWQSTGHSQEGWGVTVFRMLADSNIGKLNLRLTGGQAEFSGKIVAKDSSSGTWTPYDLNYNSNGVATGLVSGFGNTTDEVYVVTWYESAPADCDYQACFAELSHEFSSYPTATIGIEANVITGPPSLSPAPIANLTDHDNDGTTDTVQLDTFVKSDAYAENLDIVVEVYDGQNNMIDSLESRVIAGGGSGSETTHRTWFTAPETDSYSFVMRLKDLAGIVVDTVVSSNHQLTDMAPVAFGNISTYDAETWIDIDFDGNGEDWWGLTDQEGVLPHLESPAAYEWNFDSDNLADMYPNLVIPTSSLKNPSMSYAVTGTFRVTLRVLDQGQEWSDSLEWNINITDDSLPVPEIRVNNQIIENELIIQTNQMIQFSAHGTTDNVPIENLHYQWDWGDGSSDDGYGGYSQLHEWIEGDADGTMYLLNLTVNDGANSASIEINIIVMNRVPRQIFSDDFITDTLTPLQMPNVFVDDDGQLQSMEWQFFGMTNLDGDGITIDSDFSDSQTVVYEDVSELPIPTWKEPGNWTVIVTATDDDGNQSVATFNVWVRNQAPVTRIDVKDNEGFEFNFQLNDGEANHNYLFDATGSFDPDSKTDLIYSWTFSDNFTSNQSIITHMFEEPGAYTVKLKVTDGRGLDSVERTLLVRVSNPKPIIQATIMEAWLDGELVTSSTPRTDDTLYSYTQTFTETGGIFTAPGILLHFNSEGTRDADYQFFGMNDTDITSENWNGIVEYIWDFGDATPKSNDPSPWHSFTNSGTYTVTLTVKDGFENGDSTSWSKIITVDYPPEIPLSIPTGLESPVEQTQTFISMIAEDFETLNVKAWRDLEPNVDADGDGISDNDKDVDLIFCKPGCDANGLIYMWDFDDRREEIGPEFTNDLDLTNDWIYTANPIYTWNQSGNTRVNFKVCDGFGVCSTSYFDIQVRSKSGEDNALESFDWKDPSSYLLSDIGSSSLMFIALLIAVLILGYFVMRQPKGEEEDAEGASEAYDVEPTENTGGMLGMDHHSPPPKPKVLDRDERRSKNSGYVRPVTGKRK